MCVLMLDVGGGQEDPANEGSAGSSPSSSSVSGGRGSGSRQGGTNPAGNGEDSDSDLVPSQSLSSIVDTKVNKRKALFCASDD